MPTRNNERYGLQQLDSEEYDFDTLSLNKIDEMELYDQYIRQRNSLEDDDVDAEDIIKWADKNLSLEDNNSDYSR